MTQLERLQKDSAELQFYVEKLLKEGEHDLAKKISAKRKFLDDHIAERRGEKIAV